VRELTWALSSGKDRANSFTPHIHYCVHKHIYIIVAQAYIYIYIYIYIDTYRIA
jgi:hypothetical protein